MLLYTELYHPLKYYRSEYVAELVAGVTTKVVLRHAPTTNELNSAQILSYALC